MFRKRVSLEKDGLDSEQEMNEQELKQALQKCVRCGRCLANCPVYKETMWEGSVARGKLSLLKAALANQEDLGGRMKDLLSHCLLCGRLRRGMRQRGSRATN